VAVAACQWAGVPADHAGVVLQVDAEPAVKLLLAVQGEGLGVGVAQGAGEALGLVEAAPSSAWSGRAGSGVSASVRYQSSSWSCRMTANTSNMRFAVRRFRRQSRPPKVTWATCWPAPKQS
jgi:hypothetical protein